MEAKKAVNEAAHRELELGKFTLAGYSAKLSELNKKHNFGKKLVFALIFLASIWLLHVIITYNVGRIIDSKVSGILIDYESTSRGTSIDNCHLSSIDEVNPTIKSTYWFGCQFNNYSSPVLVKVIFPFDIEIVSYGSCHAAVRRTSEGGVSAGNAECYSFDATVIDGHTLQVLYTKSEVPFVQLQISANVFSIEIPDRYVFKSFQIKENPLPFLESGKFVFQNNNINYSLKIRRNEFQVLSSDSNFSPTIQNALTDTDFFRYERLSWDSEKMPGEGILYISDVEQARNKTRVNLFGTLVLGILLGILIDRVFKNF